MKKRKATTQLLILLVMSLLLCTVPASVLAQTTEPPPELIVDEKISDEDILVFEPQFYVEFPFAQGFAISINFGIKFEVPRRLLLVNNDVLNFFLRFSSYVIPDQTTTPVRTPTPAPSVTPTPTATPKP